MLIPSTRHTARDLALWREYESADRVVGRRFERSRKVERALDALRDFAAAGPCYLSTSWGKDSVVVAHLAHRLGLSHLPLVNLRVTPGRNPHCDDVRDAFLARWPFPAYQEIEVDYSILGSLTAAEWDRETDRLWNAAWRAVGREHGQRHVTGVRADESSARTMRCRIWGESSPNGCAPAAWWSTPEVFGYLVHHDLPTHPNYAMLGGGRWDRHRIRVAEIGDTHGTGMGRREWEQEYYGDVLALVEANPC